MKAKHKMKKRRGSLYTFFRYHPSLLFSRTLAFRNALFFPPPFKACYPPDLFSLRYKAERQHHQQSERAEDANKADKDDDDQCGSETHVESLSALCCSAFTTGQPSKMRTNRTRTGACQTPHHLSSQGTLTLSNTPSCYGTTPHSPPLHAVTSLAFIHFVSTVRQPMTLRTFRTHSDSVQDSTNAIQYCSQSLYGETDH